MENGNIRYSKPLISVTLLYLFGTIPGFYLADCSFILLLSLTAIVLLFIKKIRRYFIYFLVFLIAFSRASFFSQNSNNANNEFLSLCESGKNIVLSGEIGSVRSEPRLRNSRISHRFSVKNAEYRLKGRKKPLSDSIFVILYEEQNETNFYPKAGVKIELTGKIYENKKKAKKDVESSFDDPEEKITAKIKKDTDNTNIISLRDTFFVSWTGSARIINDKRKNNIFENFRGKAAEILSTGLEKMPEERDLLLAMILGYRAELSEELTEAFRNAGTIHIFSISGLHVAAIAMILVYLLSFIGISKRYVVIPLTPLLISYIYMTDMQPSAVRAGIVVVIYYFSYLFYRNPNSLNSISLTLIILLIINPLNLVDISLILSFSMVFGIILLTGPISEIINDIAFVRRFTEERELAISSEKSGDDMARVNRWPKDGLCLLYKFIIEIFSAALAASLISFPLTAYFFNNLIPYSILANMIVVPLSVPVMALPGLGLFVSVISPELTGHINYMAAIIARIMKVVSQQVAALPYSAYYFDFPLWALVLWYVVLFSSVNYIKKKVTAVVAAAEGAAR